MSSRTVVESVNYNCVTLLLEDNFSSPIFGSPGYCTTRNLSSKLPNIFEMRIVFAGSFKIYKFDKVIVWRSFLKWLICYTFKRG